MPADRILMAGGPPCTRFELSTKPPLVTRMLPGFRIAVHHSYRMSGGEGVGYPHGDFEGLRRAAWRGAR